MSTESTETAAPEAEAAESNIGDNAGNPGATGSDRQSLIALVEKTKADAERGEAPTEEADPTTDPVKAATPTPPKKKEESEEEKGSRLHRELRNREKAQGILAKAEEREVQSQAALAEANTIVQQAKQYAAQIAAEYQKFQKLRTDPVALINEMGWDPNAIIEAGANRNNPEYQQKAAAQRAADDKFAALEKQLQEATSRTKKLEDLTEHYEKQAATQSKASAEKQMLSLIPTESPARTIWSDAYILQMAYDVDRQVRARTRKPPSLSEIAEYIHFEASEKIRRLKPQEAAGRSNARQAKANGSRALSSRDASERRGAPASKDFDQMTADEQRAHLIAVAEEARRAG